MHFKQHLSGWRADRFRRQFLAMAFTIAATAGSLIAEQDADSVFSESRFDSEHVDIAAVASWEDESRAQTPEGCAEMPADSALQADCSEAAENCVDDSQHAGTPWGPACPCPRCHCALCRCPEQPQPCEKCPRINNTI
jgi:hypothetical protein